MLTELQRIQKLKEKFLSPQELQGLLEASKASIRDHAILLTSYCYGLRISEVGLLQLEDYKIDQSKIFIKRVKEGLGNYFDINDDLKKALKRLLVIRGTAPGPLFPSRKNRLIAGENGIGKRQLDWIFKKYAKIGGVYEGHLNTVTGKIEGSHMNFHTLRHTCAVNMVDADVPMKVIQDWLGHKSMQSTLIYANVSSAKREEAARKFLGVGKEKEKKGSGIDWKKMDGEKKK